MRFLLQILFAWSVAGEGDRYVIDAPASRFTAEIGAAGLLAMFGHDHAIAIREFSGEALFVADAPERSSLRITIEAGSLAEAGTEFSEEDRKAIDRDIQEKALEVSKYPQIVFKSTSVVPKSTGESQVELEIRGMLTLHGVTRPVTVVTQVTLKDDVLMARGKFTVRHSDYKVERLSAVGGTIKADNEIRLSFALVARKG